MDKNKKILTKCSSCKTSYMVMLSYLHKEVTCQKCGSSFCIQLVKAPEAYPLIAKLALSFGFINPHQLNKILNDYQSGLETNTDFSLEKALLASGLITSQQIDTLVASRSFFVNRQSGIQFGTVGVNLGLIDQEVVQKSLSEQAQEFKQSGISRLLGDILVERGSITIAQRDAIIAAQKRLSQTALEQSNINAAMPDKTQKIPKPIQIKISPHKTEAYLVLPKRQGNRFQIDDVKEALQSVGVTYGIVDDPQIDAYLKQPASQSEPLLIAEGRPVKPPVDETVTYFFDTGQETSAGTLDDDGKIDFKDRGHIKPVKQEDVLAEITPGQPGQGGIDVFGQEIPAPQPAALHLQTGNGACMAEDGRKITATADGHPQLAIDGKLSVYGEMNLDGDIGYKTGHVKFDGNVMVSGKVQSGFKVTCNNLTATEVLSADVKATGHLKILGGHYWGPHHR